MRINYEDLEVVARQNIAPNAGCDIDGVFYDMRNCVHLLKEQADRIEELRALWAVDQRMVTKVSKDAVSWKKRADKAEVKLNKAIGALEKVQAFVRDLEPHADHGHTLVPALREACEILAELKSEDD